MLIIINSAVTLFSVKTLAWLQEVNNDDKKSKPDLVACI